jgi:hypothetical protein
MAAEYYAHPPLDVDLSSTFDRILLEVNQLDLTNVCAIESNILTAQYSYVKLGLILAKVREGKLWEHFQGQYKSFANFCASMLGMNNWQAMNIIKAARVAIELFEHGYKDLPRNASQAVELAGLGIEKMLEVWDRVTSDHAPHKITAAVIKTEINPEAQPAKATISIPVALRDKIAAEAMELGISSTEYLERLVNGQLADSGRVVVEVDDISDEDKAAIDKLEQTNWTPNPNTKKTSKAPTTKPTVTNIKNTVINGFDDLMNSILGGCTRRHPTRS